MWHTHLQGQLYICGQGVALKTICETQDEGGVLSDTQTLTVMQC